MEQIRVDRLPAPYEVPAGLRAAWSDLAERLDAPPFDEPEWFTASWRHFGRGPATIVTVWSDSVLRGVAPLQSRPWVVRTLDHPQAFRSGVLVEDAFAPHLANWLFARRHLRVELHHLEDGSPWATAVWDAATHGHHDMERLDTWGSPQVDTTGDWDGFERGLKSSFRQTLKRRARRLQEQGEVSLTDHDGTNQLESLLADGFSLEASGWKQAAGSSLTADQRAGEFYRDAAAWAANRGWLRLMFLRVDGRPIAFSYTLVARGRLHVLKGGYDPAWHKFAPGSQLMHEQLRWAHRQPIDLVDMEGRAEPHKLAWNPTTRPLESLRFHSPSVLGRLERTAILARRRARRWARRQRARREPGAGSPTEAPGA